MRAPTMLPPAQSELETTTAQAMRRRPRRRSTLRRRSRRRREPLVRSERCHFVGRRARNCNGLAFSMVAMYVGRVSGINNAASCDGIRGCIFSVNFLTKTKSSLIKQPRGRRRNITTNSNQTIASRPLFSWSRHYVMSLLVSIADGMGCHWGTRDTTPGIRTEPLRRQGSQFCYGNIADGFPPESRRPFVRRFVSVVDIRPWRLAW